MIKMTLKELAELVQGEPQGDLALGIEGAAGLDEAGPADLSYLADPKFEPLLASTKAGCVLLDPAKKGAHPFAAVYVAEPKAAFAKVLAKLEAYVAPKFPAGIHPSAVVHPYAKIGRDAHIGPHAVVESGAFVGERSVVGAGCYLGHNAVVGKDCRLYPHVVVRERCTLGDRVILHPGVVIGADGYAYLPSPQGHRKVPQIGRVHIEDDVEIGANSTVDRAMTGVTRVGRGTKVDNLVQIAHNVRIGQHCLIVSQSGVAGSSELGDWVVLGGQAGLADHIKIGAKAQIAGQSGVMSDVPEGAVLFGTPARPIRESMKLQALLGKLPEMYEAYKKARKASAKGAEA